MSASWQCVGVYSTGIKLEDWGRKNVVGISVRNAYSISNRNLG